jgi:hypothetical protein
LIFWADESVFGQSIPIHGPAEIFDLYLPQKNNWTEESPGREVLPAENPSQSLDQIARPVDILSRNRRGFWVAEPLQKLSFPIDSCEAFSEAATKEKEPPERLAALYLI